MKTPKIFIQHLENKIITQEMLELCLYSVNKRAKNYRDKANQYTKECRNNYYLYDKYHYIEKYNLKKQEMYEYKELLLTLLKPKCIHKEFVGYKRKRIYDYEKEYKKIKEKDIIYSNSYYDYQKDERVYFVDIYTNEQIIHYYLYYETSNYSFHQPIDNIEGYDLEIIEINNLKTQGKDIHDLISLQFVNKVIHLILEGNYTYI